VTEHAKQPDDPRGLALSNEANDEPAGDTSPLQDVEAQMRRALGLFGLPRRQDAEQPAATRPARPAGRLSLSGHKRRFAQDGEVPVTVLNGRRTSPTDAPVNRLEAVETAVAAERAARERAERARAEAQATIHDLQTKLGHANLTQTDLQTAAQRDQDAAIAALAELRATNERLAATEAVRETLQQRLSAVEAECHEARTARRQADRARRDAEAAQADAERRLRTLDPTAGQAADRPVHQPKTSRKAKDSAKARPTAPSRRGRIEPAVAVSAPEPVQWWLMAPKKTKRRQRSRSV
jgi:hypothetical protein